MFIDGIEVGRGFRSLNDMRFGNLVVTSLCDKRNGKWRFNCKCDCGDSSIVKGACLTSGTTKSCGCLRSELMIAANSSHLSTGSPEWTAWRNMIQRCTNKKAKAFMDYGGRGISIFDEWIGPEGFGKFVAYVGKRPSPKHSIDRYPNNNGNYEPGNVRWATRVQQNRNRRNTIFVLVGGLMTAVGQISDESGMSCEKIRKRIKRGWQPSEIIDTQLGYNRNKP